MKAILTLLVLLSVAAYADKFDCAALLASETPEEAALAANRVHAALLPYAVGAPQTLKVATWNLDLLTHFIKAVTAQDYTIRAATIPLVLTEFLKSPEAPDVFTLQEVWNKNARKDLDRVATEAGYRVIDKLSSQSEHHGLQIWVRDDVSVEASGFSRFPRAFNFSAFEVAGRVQRGVLWVKLRLRDGQSVLVATSHLTPFARYATRRMGQITHISRKLRTLQGDADHVLLTGDLNIAADFSYENEVEAKDLKRVRHLYSFVARTTGLRDTFRAVNASEVEPGYTYNRDFLRAKVNGLIRKGGSKRLDYIFGAEQNGGVAQFVRAAGTLFREKWNPQGEKDDNGTYLSDHFLVLSTIDFFRVPREKN